MITDSGSAPAPAEAVPTGRPVPVGVDAISSYCGSAYVEVAELFTARGLDPARLGNLGMLRKSVAAPWEDTVAIAASAALPLVESMTPDERASVRTLVVATESPLDLSKAAATHVHRLLELPRQCRLFEVKQACHGGVAALQVGAALVASEPGSTALVIASDVPLPSRGTYMEPSQGAGAVAVVVSEDPRIAEIELGTAGCFSYETFDFARPRADVDIMDTDLSLMTYLDCLVGAFRDHAARAPGRHYADSFALLAMHTPFPGMVRGAHRTALRRLTGLPRAEEAADFERRVAPSLELPEQVGNIYAATTLLATSAALAAADDDARVRLGVFSYGSGCASEFLSLTVVPGGPARVRAGRSRDQLAARRHLTVAAYDSAVDGLRTTGFGTRDVLLATSEQDSWPSVGRPRAALVGVRDFRREYTWLPA